MNGSFQRLVGEAKRAWRRARFLLLVLCGTLGLQADPFLRDYALALGQMRLDGDLIFRVPIGKFKLGGTWVEVALDHRMEPLDYGEVRSRLVLRPFESGVFPRGRDALAWLRPGGGEEVFTAKDRPPEVDAAMAELARRFAPDVTPAALRVYLRHGIVLLTDGAGRWCLVKDEDWILRYAEGHLTGITTPTGEQIEVAGDGRRVASLRRGGSVLASVAWNDRGVATGLTLGDESFVMAVDPQGQITAVHDGLTSLRAEFRYGGDHLLRSFSQRNRDSCDFSWRPNPGAAKGNSPYRQIWHIAQAGDVGYRYEISNEVIRMMSIDRTGKSRQLTVGIRYGNIKWVVEE